MTAQEQIQINELNRKYDKMANDIAEMKAHMNDISSIKDEMSKMTDAINNIPTAYIPRTWATTTTNVLRWVIATAIGIAGLFYLHRNIK